MTEALSKHSLGLLERKNKPDERGLTPTLAILLLLTIAITAYEVANVNIEHQDKQDQQMKMPDNSASAESLPSQIGPVSTDLISSDTSKTKIELSSDPPNPNAKQPTQLTIRFMDGQTNSFAKHVDYKVAIMRGTGQVFGTALLHSVEGLANIPYKFENTGTYLVIVEVNGVWMMPTSEKAEFAINVETPSAYSPT